MKRVLKEDGYSIHAMPTGAWRAWTNLAHYVELVQRVIVRLIGCIPGLNSSKEVDKGRGGVIQTTGRDILTGDLATWTKFASKRFQRVINNLFPCRHGETGNCISEIYTFSRARWTRHFSKNQYIEIEAFPMGLFYTGRMVLNHYLSISAREKLAKIFGSSCVLYKIKQAPLYNQNQSQFP
jgi:hypothetical protein